MADPIQTPPAAPTAASPAPAAPVAAAPTATPPAAPPAAPAAETKTDPKPADAPKAPDNSEWPSAEIAELAAVLFSDRPITQAEVDAFKDYWQKVVDGVLPEEPQPVADAVVVPAGPVNLYEDVTTAVGAANHGLRLRLSEMKQFVAGFEHDVADDLKEVVDFLKAKL